MSTLAERIKTERIRQGMNQVELGQAVGVSKSSVNQWESGLTKKLVGDNLLKTAKALEVSPDWLSTGKGDKHGLDNHADKPGLTRRNQERVAEPPGDKFKKVRYGKFNLSAGVNGFSIDYDDSDNEPLFYQESWLLKKGLKAENLVACEIKGDSMEPGLYSGDTVLIDLSKTHPEDGEVSAINYEGELLIKRMHRDSGQWWLQSDNSDKTRHPNKLCASDYCLIIGRVVNKTSSII